MLKISFPDGRTQTFKKELNGFEIAESISKSLSKKAVAMKVDGTLMDLCDSIKTDSAVEIITLDSDEGLEIMRHTVAAQVLAKAIKNLYPNSKLAIGPTIQDGFYYDVLFEEKISIDQFPLIENEMNNIIQKGEKIIKSLKKKDEVLEIFKSKNENYKVQIIENSDQEDNFQIYQQGDTDFIDLCRGPHLHDLKKVGAFKLTKLAGAYWRGDSKNEMLQRIYGTAWSDKNQLDSYLGRISEAEKRDHRKIGKALDLFHFQEDAPGAVFWHPRGWTIFKTLVEYMRVKQQKANYLEINTPTVMDRSLWEKSGHWEKFHENMYTTETEDERIFALKPMNCPGGVQVFNSQIRSYKELPLRVAEFGKVFRYEPSGALHGLMRVREFTQDDAHIYCLREQMQNECIDIIKLTLDIYKDFGFDKIKIKFSDRPKKRIGNDEVWDFLEKALLESMHKLNLKYEVNQGEGAFYGPKIEFVLIDALSREWQCGTIQVDLNLPPRLEASFIDSNGEKQFPVMIHRAFFGSLERFIGILIENNSGKLPVWLSPIQVGIANINDNCKAYCNSTVKKLEKFNIRCKFDDRQEKLNYKIREFSLQKIPFIAVVGAKEITNNTLNIRELGSENQYTIEIDEFIKKIKNSCRIP